MDSRQIHASAALPPGTYWIRGSVKPIAGLDNLAKRKFSTLLGPELRPLVRPALSKSLYRLLYPGSCCYYYRCVLTFVLCVALS
jgi:hypothetical protein